MTAFKGRGEYEYCTLCPRECGVDRAAGQTGFCGETSEMRVAWAGLHFGEEPPVSGLKGSGAVFLTGCTLGCSICQNRQISQGGLGRTASAEEMAEIWAGLHARSAENINLVTGTHFLPGISETLDHFGRSGLSLPVVWNTSGYERSRTIEYLSQFVDIFLTDLKTLSTATCRDLAIPDDYPQIASHAAIQMAASTPFRLDAGRLVRGVIVRHLVLPGELQLTRDVLEWFAVNLAENAYLSLMFQYTPVTTHRETRYSRRLTRREYDTVLIWLDELGIQDGFYQEYGTDTGWLPDFSREDPFAGKDAKTLWSCVDRTN